LKPVERRLLSEAREAWRPLGLVLMAGLLGALALIAQAALLARIVSRAFLDHAPTAALVPSLLLLVGVALLRGLAVFGGQAAGQAAAAQVRSRLRISAARRHLELSRREQGSSGDLLEALTAGAEALDRYFSGYLPQLVLAVTVPVLVLLFVAPRDLLSAGIMAATLPLVPVFMALIGLGARRRAETRWFALSLLSAHFLDAVQGLTTLRLFGRARAQEKTVRTVSDGYRRETMANLRLAFLSSLVLELAGTLATALVAVAIGIRLAQGTLSLEVGLGVLILTPELYLPLRRLGAQFHTSLDALAPAERIFRCLAEPGQPGGGLRVDLRRQPMRLAGVRFTFPDRPELLAGVDFELRPGERVAVVGGSGEGKTTLAALLLGFEDPSAGTLSIGDQPLARLDLAYLREQIAWLPQRPYLFALSVAANIAEGRPGAGAHEIEAAAAEAGIDFDLDRFAGENGRLLSAGQAQRVALARALLRQAPLLILDEPTANLDVRTALAVRRLLRSKRPQTVLLITHSQSLAAAAERVVRLERGRLQEPVPLAVTG